MTDAAPETPAVEPSAEKLKLGVLSLGCPKNLVDTEVLLGKAAQQDYMICADPADAEPTKHDKGELDTPSEHARAVSDLVFMRLEFHLCAINRWTGELAWSHSPSFFGGKSVSTFIRAGDRLFVLGNALRLRKAGDGAKTD